MSPGDYSEHGTPGKYRAGCRCDDCRRNQRERCRRVFDTMKARGRENPALIPHGTKGGFSNWGCRCGDCTAANIRTCSEWYAKAAAS